VASYLTVRCGASSGKDREQGGEEKEVVQRVEKRKGWEKGGSRRERRRVEWRGEGGCS